MIKQVHCIKYLCLYIVCVCGLYSDPERLMNDCLKDKGYLCITFQPCTLCQTFHSEGILKFDMVNPMVHGKTVTVYIIQLYSL